MEEVYVWTLADNSSRASEIDVLLSLFWILRLSLSLIRLSLLVTEPQGSTCPYLPSARIARPCMGVVLEINSDPQLHGKNFTSSNL